MVNRHRDTRRSVQVLVGTFGSEAVIRRGLNHDNVLVPPGYNSSSRHPFYNNHHGSRNFQHTSPSDDEYDPTSAFMGIFPLLRKIFLYFITGIGLLITSLTLYGIFYKCTMPGLHASESLYFDYTGLARHPVLVPIPVQLPVPPNVLVLHSSLPHVSSAVVIEDLQQECDDFNSTNITDECSIDNSSTGNINDTNNSSSSNNNNNITENDGNNNKTPVATPFTQQSSIFTPSSSMSESDNSTDALIQGAPWAVADLFARHSRWEAHHPDIVPLPKAKTRILTSGRPHYIEILLDVPESDMNRYMGMFGVMVELQSSDGSKLASSIRTARVPYESLWISVVRKFICIIPHVIGALPESRRVLVPSFRYYVESNKLPLVRIHNNDNNDDDMMIPIVVRFPSIVEASGSRKSFITK
jgi:hypothetical protein